MFVLAASPAFSQANFYVATAIPPGIGTKIKSLPYTISSPGLYYLGGNLSYSAAGNAITISSNDVVLDLMGFELLGNPASHGIRVNSNSVEIRNGTVRSFDTGISSTTNVYGLHLNNLRAYAGRNGFDLSVNNSASVVGCDCSGNSEIGVALKAGLVSGCMANANGTGYYISGAANVLGNSATNNSYRGFDIVTSAYVLMDRNMANGNTNANYANSAPSAITWGVNAGR
ncbi:hypothetical protein [Fundidesulfovibrio agrisoli]|uniref:hypothetical protein n=1 Tax=Fundidesulfovibrio agrisoli TaxID=2922717 RepID=UPI001FAD4A95|nr:hypothetical protein [Fundidesulfovibrio agrisoli]